MAETAKYPCPKCGKTVGTTKRGRVRVHKEPKYWGGVGLGWVGGWQKCDGSGELPQPGGDHG